MAADPCVHRPREAGAPVILVATGTRLFLLALPPYFAWEMLQVPAFTGMPADWRAATMVCAQATVGDGVIVLALFGVGVLVFRDRRWFTPPRLGRYAAVVAVAMVVQVMVEWIMVYRLGRWGYAPWQPLLPLLGVGVLPVVQPVVLLPPVFWALARTSGQDAHPHEVERA